ncbi:hypothetical protein THASP1DRAFT_28429 [Thamnocephalis sphaerospora]|uniref:DEAD-box helicase OB fold domain-containing protein n=1 Tax=Thamnocephalis sphaerospora TaxID=78915 RepID=A0A4P9XUA0_9FUNG|nr:hypothetical protein THASP1DRAFT_28429 [Thamnocephalis sphaerospora]|eukprot:RKP09776.1 hypothetical protein THASP1DRAFT_28429 [Thamnocephalis sphaerospora]
MASTSQSIRVIRHVTTLDGRMRFTRVADATMTAVDDAPGRRSHADDPMPGMPPMLNMPIPVTQQVLVRLDRQRQPILGFGAAMTEASAINLMRLKQGYEQEYWQLSAMLEIRKLRRQLTNIVQVNCPGVDVCINPQMPPPSALQSKLLRQILMTGFIDQVAVRKDLVDSSVRVAKRSRDVPYATMWSEEDAYLHPTSVLYGASPAPEMVIYGELLRTSKVWLQGATAVERRWAPLVGKPLCIYGKPLASPAPQYNATKDIATVFVVPSFGPKSWTLPAVKAQQRRVGTRWQFDRVL